MLARELADLAPVTIERVGATGIVARLRGTTAGAPVVAIRGDIDALPIQENIGSLPSRRLTPSVDARLQDNDVHATWAVGAAALLGSKPAAGDVLIVLQPAEELGLGAQAILDSGRLDEVQMIFGGHVDRRFTVGQVVAQAGPLAASADEFEIVLMGRGAHGARPHESADPIVALAALITALQTIVSRRVNPASPAVVTVGAVAAVACIMNVIPIARRSAARCAQQRSRRARCCGLKLLRSPRTSPRRITWKRRW